MSDRTIVGRRGGKNRGFRPAQQRIPKEKKGALDPKEAFTGKIKNILVSRYNFDPADADDYRRKLLSYHNITVTSPNIWAALFSLIKFEGNGGALKPNQFSPGVLDRVVPLIVNDIDKMDEMKRKIAREKVYSSILRYYMFLGSPERGY